jgi:hypothetical protein
LCYFIDFFVLNNKVFKQLLHPKVELFHGLDFLYACSQVFEKFDEALIGENNVAEARKIKLT